MVGAWFATKPLAIATRAPSTSQKKTRASPDGSKTSATSRELPNWLADTVKTVLLRQTPPSRTAMRSSPPAYQ
jgi:hypothetical protein